MSQQRIEKNIYVGREGWEWNWKKKAKLGGEKGKKGRNKVKRSNREWECETGKSDLKKWMNRCAKCGVTESNGKVPAKSSYPIDHNGIDTSAINGYHWLMQPRRLRWSLGPARKPLAYVGGGLLRGPWDYIVDSSSHVHNMRSMGEIWCLYCIGIEVL